MHRRTWLFMSAALGLLPGVAEPASPPAERVLFVGNSLTYYGNLPAVVAALAASSGRPVATDMIVTGGATLAQRAADGSVARALAATSYTALVLQERGGTLACWPAAKDCVESRQAIQALARLARSRGVAAALLGTYNGAQALPRLEAEAAAAAGIPYLPVDEVLRRARRAAPELIWLDADGAHPGRDLTLLNALIVHRWRFGSLPAPAPLTVRAPIYGARSDLQPVLRPSDAPPPRQATPREARYTEDTLRRVIGVLAAGPASAPPGSAPR